MKEIYQDTTYMDVILNLAYYILFLNIKILNDLKYFNRSSVSK